MNRSVKPFVDEKYIRPKKANKLMKSAQNIRQTVYIYGISGYGKTSFAANFLSGRRYVYYSAADTTAADLNSCLENLRGRENIVVVDDLYLVDTADARELYYPLLEELTVRSDVWLILISRCPIPVWLKPLYIRRIFVTIGENELRLTRKEEELYFEKWELYPMQETMKWIEEMGCGNPFFFRIAAIRLLKIKEHVQKMGRRLQAELAAVEFARKDAWDYMEVYIYDKWSIELQEFLMDISVVEEFDLQMAQLITKKNDVGKIIRAAQETGNFLIEHAENDHVVYELIVPMKYSMRRRLQRKCSEKHIDQLYYSAGGCYELQGDVLKALRMYEKCRNEDGISKLLIGNARNYVGVGHYWELRRYYLALSEETIKHSPELMAGMSLLQSILLNDEESERWYYALKEYAKLQTGSVRKSAQAKLLYLDISLPHRGTGQMVDILKHAGVLLAEGKLVVSEVSLTNNQPSMMNGGKDFCEWSKRDRELAKSIGKIIEIVLGRFGKGLVNLALAESLFEKGGDNYEVSALANKGRIQAEYGGKAEQVFVAVGIMAQLAVLNNHIEDALESLESFKMTAEADAPQLLDSIDTLKTRFLLYTGRSGEVSDWMKRAPDEEKEFCTLERYRYITKVRVYLATGRKEKALNLLLRLGFFAEKRQRIFLQIEIGVLLAITQFRMGDGVWRETLQNAVTQAEGYHFVRIFSREGKALWELLKAGDFIWQNAEFKKQVLAECRQMAELYPVYLSEKQEGNVLLSDKALKILRLQAEGMSVEQIAEIMCLSKAGVKYYNQETYKKLGVSSKAAAITEARNQRII